MAATYLAVALFRFLISLNASAEVINHASSADQPLFESGLFAVHGALADYPASNEYRYRTLILPYVIYRGDFLKSDNRESYLYRTDANWSYLVSVGFNLYESDSRVPLEYVPPVRAFVIIN